MSILSENRPFASNLLKCTMSTGGSRANDSFLDARRLTLHCGQSLIMNVNPNMAQPKDVETYHASSFSSISSLKKASRHRSIGILPLLALGIGSCNIEKTL